MKIAIYCRKSVFTGKGESIENQIDMCKKYILAKIPNMPEEEIEIYEDEGFSAKNTDRPEFKRLLKKVRAGEIRAVVCYRLDRISRSVSDFSALTEEFHRRGVSFVSVREEFDTSTPMGKAMMYIASVFAQLERETIAERVKDNMAQLARSGRWLGGTPPMGFRSEKIDKITADGRKKTMHCLVEEQEEAQIVKQIYSYFLSLKKITAVKKRLDEQETVTRQGKLFSLTAIKNILTNPVYAACDASTYAYFSEKGANVSFDERNFKDYAGILPYGRRSYEACVHRKTPEERWIVAAGEHKALVSGESWVLAQKLLGGRKTVLGCKASNRYALLSGFLYCKCGKAMTAKKRSNSDILYDYICSGKLSCGKSKCSVSNLGGAEADMTVLKVAAQRYSVSEKFFADVGKMKEEIISKENFKIKSEMEKCSIRINNLIRTIAKEDKDDGFVLEIRREINRLTEIREKLSAELSGQYFDKNISSNASEDITIDEKRAFLSFCIEKIVWDGKELCVFMYDTE